LIKSVLAVIGFICFALPAWAQGTWDDLPCEQSFLTWEPALKCQRSGASRSHGDGVGVVSSQYFTTGNVSGVTLNAFLAWPVGDGTFIKAYTTENAVRGIKNFSQNTYKNSANWSEPRGFGEVTLLTFSSGGRSCVGFDAPGPMFEYGYRWRLIGDVCRAKVDDAEAFLKDVLAALRIGPPGTDKNALGGTVRAFKWPGSVS
jgi:hypothetical protein